jgi:hypothetical protein
MIFIMKNQKFRGRHSYFITILINNLEFEKNAKN